MTLSNIYVYIHTYIQRYKRALKYKDEGTEVSDDHKFQYPPLRHDTVKLLSEPPEEAWTTFALVLAVVALGTFGFNVYSQINVSEDVYTHTCIYTYIHLGSRYI
jgi:hypothetical protein